VLYRHFADRATLMHAVVLEALISTAEAVRQARSEHSDPMDALAAYIHAVIDLRTSAVIPALLGAIDLDEPRIKEARTASAELVEELLDTARKSGGCGRTRRSPMSGCWWCGCRRSCRGRSAMRCRWSWRIGTPICSSPGRGLRVRACH